MTIRAVHLTILSRSDRIYTTRRLLEAARSRGLTAKVVDPLDVELGLGEDVPALHWRRKRFPRTDVVIPRIGSSVEAYGLAVVSQLELLGLPVLNSSSAIASSRNRARSLQLLAAGGVRVPRTVMASGAGGLREMARLVGGVPVLVKLSSPGEKSGLIVCETWESLEAALEAILGLGQNMVVQQYIHGVRGRDLRAIVVGGEVVAALRRRQKVGRFNSNLRRGSRFEKADLPGPHIRAAVKAARVLGLEVCAVDLLDVRGKPLVFDVNSSPGIKEAELACGVDVAARIVERAVLLARERGAGPSPRRPGAALVRGV